MFGDEVKMVDEAERLLEARVNQCAAEESCVESAELLRESGTGGAKVF